jgi:hypothetical protein
MLPCVQARAVCSAVHEGEGRLVLPDADVIIGCLDNAETRWWLNQHAVQYLQPYFDVGVLVEPGLQPQFSVRVNTIVPGAGPCGQCTPIDFLPRQRPEAFLDAQVLHAQRSAGYLVGQPSGPGSGDPSLYGLNLQAVGLLMQEFTAWCCGREVAHTLRQLSTEAGRQWLPLHAFGGTGPHDCPLCAGLLGATGSEPLPKARDDAPDTAASSLSEAREALLGP